MIKRLSFAALACVASTAQATTTIDFNELDPANRPLFSGTNFDGNNPGFNSQDAVFQGGFWGGFSYSNDTDTTTPGFTNQYAAYTGTDYSGTGNYAIASGGGSTFVLPAGMTVQSIRVTNTTYAVLSMLSGDQFAKAFGGVSGDDPDFFDVIFTGKDDLDQETGSVTFRLADYTFADNNQDYIVDTWERIDLTALGSATSVALTWESSDVNSGGFINTPLYIAADNLVLVPEPTSAMLLALSGLAVLRRRR